MGEHLAANYRNAEHLQTNSPLSGCAQPMQTEDIRQMMEDRQHQLIEQIREEQLTARENEDDIVVGAINGMLPAPANLLLSADPSQQELLTQASNANLLGILNS